MWLYVTIVLLSWHGLNAKPPHVLFILADDFGWNDIGYHGSEIRTPTLDKLASSGVKLENYYVQPYCTASRSQLMTGRYQIRTGLQHKVIYAPQPAGLPLEERTLAEGLRELGYATHIVGKWHLGFYRSQYLPTHRGFQSFYGFASSDEDYYTKVDCQWARGYPSPPYNDTCGYDFYSGAKVLPNITEYSAHDFARRAIQVAEGHDPEKPLFLYLPFQSVHAPLQVPRHYYDMYPNIKNESRRIYAGMVTCMDEAIRNVTETFRRLGLWEDTVLVFSTDNGGEIHFGGNNWPLRGYKTTLWEGGVRGVGFVHGSRLKQPKSTRRQMMHVSDWYPTILTLAGATVNYTNLDSFNVWDAISENAISPRNEILHNIDPVWTRKGHNESHPGDYDVTVRAAIRVGDWKLLTGDPGDSSWVPLPPHHPINHTAAEVRQNIWLFNVARDPEEKEELSAKYPDVVTSLMARLASYNATAVPTWYPEPDPTSEPRFHGGNWQPWVE